MALDAEQVTTMLVEIVTGKPPSLKTPEADKVRAQLKQEVAEILAKGGVVDVPHEIPDIS